MAFGAAALDMAKSDDGFKKAAVEFETAAKLAPRWSAPYYNLGVIYSKLEDWEDALTNYNKYLELSPKAKDAETVKAEIYKLEYKKQQQFDLSQFNGFYDSNGDTENPMFSLSFIDRGESRATFQITYQRNDENFVLRLLFTALADQGRAGLPET
jgi:tetratricopeptide (TPR) repeat protein